MAPETDGNGTGYTTLSSTLWRLREVLDQLVFKVFETQLILQSGQRKWLAAASRELDAALQEVRHVEVMRAVETITIADRLGLPPALTLAQLIRSAGAPWDTIFEEHREALLALTGDVARATAALPPIPAPGRPARRGTRATGRATGGDATAGEGLVIDVSWADAGRAGEPDELDELDIVVKFLAETLANATQASLTAFLA